MAEYTYEDIIMDPNDPRLEGAIGKECYFNDSPKMILEHANNNSPNNFFSLKEINKNNEYPFTDGKYEDVWTLIIIKKEEPKKYVPFESKEEFIRTFDNHTTNLDIVSTEYALLRYGMWIKTIYSEKVFQVTIIEKNGIYDDGVSELINWELLLNEFTFLDGSPCGKLAEEKQ